MLAVRLAAGLFAGIATAAATALICHLVSGWSAGAGFQRLLRSSESEADGWHLHWLRKRKENKLRQKLDRTVVRWVDLVYVAVAGGMNMHTAIESTTQLAEPPMRDLLTSARTEARAGESFLEKLLTSLEDQGGRACRQVAHLLRDCARRGLPARSALADLQDDLAAEQRHGVRVRLRTLGLRLAVGTVLFLFPPVFVVIILPNVLAFVGW